MKRKTIQLILIFLTGFNLSVSNAKAQDVGEVIVTYDFSGSMRAKETSPQHFKTWNEILIDLLFDSRFSMGLGAKIIAEEPGIELPLIQDNTALTFLGVGDNLVPYIESRRNISRDEFSSFLPGDIKELNHQTTHIYKAELHFLKKAARESNTLWINVSDEDNDIGGGTRGVEAESNELINLRNDIHVVTLLNISINDHVHISVRKRKAEYKRLLSLQASNGILNFREVDLDGDFGKAYELVPNSSFRIDAQDVNTAEIKNLTLELMLNDKDENSYEEQTLRISQLPHVVNSIPIKSESAMQAILAGQPDHLLVRATYSVGNKLYEQDVSIPVSFGSSGLGWLGWLFGVLLVGLVAFFVLKKSIGTSKFGDEFTLIGKPKNIHEYLVIKKNEKIRFGRTSFTKTNEKVCDQKAPEYSLLRIEDNAFQLFHKDREAERISLSIPFQIVDQTQTQLELTLLEGRVPKINGRKERRGPLSQTKSQKNKRLS